MTPSEVECNGPPMVSLPKKGAPPPPRPQILLGASCHQKPLGLNLGSVKPAASTSSGEGPFPTPARLFLPDTCGVSQIGCLSMAVGRPIGFLQKRNGSHVTSQLCFATCKREARLRCLSVSQRKGFFLVLEDPRGPAYIILDLLA